MKKSIFIITTLLLCSLVVAVSFTNINKTIDIGDTKTDRTDSYSYTQDKLDNGQSDICVYKNSYKLKCYRVVDEKADEFISFVIRSDSREQTPREKPQVVETITGDINLR